MEVLSSISSGRGNPAEMVASAVTKPQTKDSKSALMALENAKKVGAAKKSTAPVKTEEPTRK